MPSGVYERSPEYRERVRQQRLGKKATPETLARMSEAQKGKVRSPETREKIRATLTGRKHTPEAVEKMRASAVGKVISPETRAKTSAANAGRFKGAEHHGWKGDDVAYFGLHRWLIKNFPKTGVCEHCGKVATGRAHDYASVGHTYTRKREDWLELCRKCHKALDKKPPREP